jgi:hypothetical protein
MLLAARRAGARRHARNCSAGSVSRGISPPRRYAGHRRGTTSDGTRLGRSRRATVPSRRAIDSVNIIGTNADSVIGHIAIAPFRTQNRTCAYGARPRA